MDVSIHSGTDNVMRTQCTILVLTLRVYVLTQELITKSSWDLGPAFDG